MTLFACGGGSGSGSSGGGGAASAASINTTNERSLGTAAAEGVKAAVKASGPLRETAERSEVKVAIDSLVNKLAAQPVDVSSSVCPNGGSATGDSSSNSNGSVNVTFAYNNCNSGFGVLNGSGSSKITTAGDITTIVLSYNITYTSGGTTENLDYSSTCTTSPSGTSCTYDADATGIDGRTYGVSNSSVSGNSSSGYTVSTTVTDPDYGTFSIETTSPILLNCSNGQPSSGVIVFTDNDGVTATITFDSCTGFTISYSGTSASYTWPTT